MVQFKRLLVTDLLPLGGRGEAVLRWINLAVVPLVWMLAGVYRTSAVATTRFEEFAGTLLSIQFAMLWAVMYAVLARRPKAR